MLPTTPFSGLSLFTHLLIIVIANVYGFFSYAVLGHTKAEIMEKRIKIASKPASTSKAVVASKSVLSVFVIVAMMFATLSFITIAIQTAIVTGENEIQRNFIQNNFNYRGEAKAPPASPSALQTPITNSSPSVMLAPENYETFANDPLIVIDSSVPRHQ